MSHQKMDESPLKNANESVTIQLEVDPPNSHPIELIILVSHDDVHNREVQTCLVMKHHNN